MAEDERNVEVVIATTDWVMALGFIAKKAQQDDRLELQFMDNYAPTVEYLIQILRKGFGWMEVDRGVKEVRNKRCVFNDHGRCTHEGLGGIQCKSTTRDTCEYFKQRDRAVFRANFIIIEKAGGIRGM